MEAEQTGELAEPSQMTSVPAEQPEASEAAAGGDGEAGDDEDAAEGQPSEQDQVDEDAQEGSDNEGPEGEQSEAPLVGEEADDAAPEASRLSLHSSQAQEEQEASQADEPQPEASEAAAPAAEESAAEPEGQAAGEDAAGQDESAAEAEHDSEAHMESECEVPLASMSAASVPVEDSQVESLQPAQEEGSLAEVPAEASQDAVQAEPSTAGASPLRAWTVCCCCPGQLRRCLHAPSRGVIGPVHVSETWALFCILACQMDSICESYALQRSRTGWKKSMPGADAAAPGTEPEVAPEASQDVGEAAVEPKQPVSSVQASPFSAAAAGMSRLGSHGRTSTVSQSMPLTAAQALETLKSLSLLRFEQQGSGVRNTE